MASTIVPSEDLREGVARHSGGGRRSGGVGRGCVVHVGRMVATLSDESQEATEEGREGIV